MTTYTIPVTDDYTAPEGALETNEAYNAALPVETPSEA